MRAPTSANAPVSGDKVHLFDGDIRQTLTIITPSRKKFELNFWGVYSSFSSIGEKIGWRTNRGIPVALIARYNVANADDSTKTTSYLMFLKLEKNAPANAWPMPPLVSLACKLGLEINDGMDN